MATSTAPKKPQDRKPKQGTSKKVTVEGVTLDVSPEVFDDLDFLDALDQIQEGNALRIAGALRAVAGSQYKEMREALRDKETGRIPMKRAVDFFTEVMKQAAPNS